MTDEAAVRAVVQTYVDGTVEGDADKLASVFHPQAVMTGYIGEQLLCGSPEPFLDAVRNNPPAGEGGGYAADITQVEVNGAVATATLVEKGLMGANFVDHFHLVQADDRWSIVAKTFHAEPA